MKCIIAKVIFARPLNGGELKNGTVTAHMDETSSNDWINENSQFEQRMILILEYSPEKATSKQPNLKCNVKTANDYQELSSWQHPDMDTIISSVLGSSGHFFQPSASPNYGVAPSAKIIYKNKNFSKKETKKILSKVAALLQTTELTDQEGCPNIPTQQALTECTQILQRASTITRGLPYASVMTSSESGIRLEWSNGNSCVYVVFKPDDNFQSYIYHRNEFFDGIDYNISAKRIAYWLCELFV